MASLRPAGEALGGTPLERSEGRGSPAQGLSTWCVKLQRTTPFALLQGVPPTNYSLCAKSGDVRSGLSAACGRASGERRSHRPAKRLQRDREVRAW
jgi:hypothetical protein